MFVKGVCIRLIFIVITNDGWYLRGLRLKPRRLLQLSSYVRMVELVFQSNRYICVLGLVMLCSRCFRLFVAPLTRFYLDESRSCEAWARTWSWRQMQTRDMMCVSHRVHQPRRLSGWRPAQDRVFGWGWWGHQSVTGIEPCWQVPETFGDVFPGAAARFPLPPNI